MCLLSGAEPSRLSRLFLFPFQNNLLGKSLPSAREPRCAGKIKLFSWPHEKSSKNGKEKLHVTTPSYTVTPGSYKVFEPRIYQTFFLFLIPNKRNWWNTVIEYHTWTLLLSDIPYQRLSIPSSCFKKKLYYTFCLKILWQHIALTYLYCTPLPSLQNLIALITRRVIFFFSQDEILLLFNAISLSWEKMDNYNNLS